MAPHKAWPHRLRHSLRWRLVSLFLLLALALSLAFVVGVQKSFSLGWRDAVRPLLADYVDRLAADIGTPPDPVRAQALVTRLPISVRIEGPLTNFDSHPQRADQRWHRGEHGRDMDNARLLQRTTTDGHTIAFGIGDLDWRRGAGAFVWITLAVLLFLTALAFAYVRRLFKPVDDIGAGVRRFGVGDFAQPIPVRRRDELGDLAEQINTMARDINQMLEAKRGLLLAISHELRSPLTRARLNTELLPESPDTLEARKSLLRDLAEMTQLISDLLESERLSSRHKVLNLEATDLGLLVMSVVEEMNAKQEPKPGLPRRVPISAQIEPGLPVLMLDRVRVRLLLRNLINNALTHGMGHGISHGIGHGIGHGMIDGPPGATPVEVGLNQGAGELRLTVRDHGAGVPEAQLILMAEPFYRADSARQRSTGGVGLGLYLSRLVAQAHGGTLSINNAGPGLAV